MRSDIDRASPVPVYHQIAESLRYAVATGRIRPGDALPTLRDAAGQWGVNLHTVRHAYAELARQGLVATRGPRGTTVLATPEAEDLQRSNWDSLTVFLRRIADEARRLHGLTAGDLARLLAGTETPAASRSTRVTVVECSATQAKDLAGQIAERWQVDAQLWSLETPGEPEPGPIVATYFHYNTIRQRWPERFADIHFAAIRPDPALPRRLSPRGSRDRRSRVILCERDESMARSILADLAPLFPANRFSVVPRVTRSPASLLRGHGARTPVLFAPRMWGQLTPTQRKNARAFEVRYIFVPDEIEALAKRLGWERRTK